MARIYYGVTGEGRGHATRAHTLVEALREQHEITLFAPAMAYDMLAPIYAGSAVKVNRIPGLLFHYDRQGRIHYGRTASAALRYIAGLDAQVSQLTALMKNDCPDLVITDFEPSLPRAAHKLGIPYISVDHQHFLKVYDLGELPLHLRLHAAFMSQWVGLYYRNQVASVVSSFYFPPLKRGCHNVTQVGVLLKPEVIQAKPQHGDYLVAYLRRFLDPRVEHMLRGCGREVRIYGLGAQPSRANLSFCEIDPVAFVKDLAGCAALVSTAGNQLLGEALFLGKPALVMPERGNHEQEINAWFLERSGAGRAIPMAAVEPADLQTFLERLETYRQAIRCEGMCGNTATLSAIRRHLPDHSLALPARPKLSFSQQSI